MKTSTFQCKMRGKKTMTLWCGCCTALNLRDKIKEEEKKREVKDFLLTNTTF